MTNDLISRQAAIDALEKCHKQCCREDATGDEWIHYETTLNEVESIPPAPKNDADCISRQAAIDAIDRERKNKHLFNTAEDGLLEARGVINTLPSAQPERTCVNCGRTANNGGWYADGRTRCPIEEHYALPKDGYCHLWEKRNVTDDDYPERRTDD